MNPQGDQNGPGNVPARSDVPHADVLGWLVDHTARHGPGEWSVHGNALHLVAGDGTAVSVQAWGGAPEVDDGDLDAFALATWGTPPDPVGILLVRRGGYAVGLAQGGKLIDHKCGTRYVQSRTAAGGWSQQRYARRRGNQADALVGRVVDLAAERFSGQGGLHKPSGILVGGDRSLCQQALSDARLSAVNDLPRREMFDLPEPRLATLKRAAWLSHTVTIRILQGGT